MSFGPWLERLEALAAGRELVATGGWRDAPGITAGSASVVPVSLLEDKGTGWSLDANGPVRALAFVGDELLIGGGDANKLVAWDVTGQKAVASLELGAGVRSLALDANVARGDAGTIAVGTADGALHVIAFAVQNGTPKLGPVTRRALSEGAITAVAFDPAGLVVAGGADGQLFTVSASDAAAQSRAISPGGDGGIRAIACIGDGRAAIGCGDGSLRLCFLVGDVEAQDRSGDHGHAAPVRGVLLGPTVVDNAGREQARRIYTIGEDGAVKSWFLDGGRRPKTFDINIGPLTASALQLGPVAKVDKAQGRLWVASNSRKIASITLGPDGDQVGGAQVLGSKLDRLSNEVRGQLRHLSGVAPTVQAGLKVRLAAVQELTHIPEDEARVLLDVAAGDTNFPEVRLAGIQAIVLSVRRASRPAVRAALAATQPEVRLSAFQALLDLDRGTPLVAIRSGITASAEDVRQKAVDALIPLAPTSVIAAGMIADALRDGSPNVRKTAFAALRSVAPPLEAVRTALSRGTSDIRAQALLVLGFVLKGNDAPARALSSGALDDPDGGVRTAAFLTAIIQRQRLAPKLYAVVPSIRQMFDQIATQFGAPLNLGPAPDKLEDDELEPLFAALACRAADAAIRGAGALLALGDPRALGAILQLTREPEPALRRGATANLVQALARWPEDDRLSARLTWLLDDADTEVRTYAYDALAKTAATGGPTAELDLAEIALRGSQEDIRVRALQILVRVGAPGSAQDISQRAHVLLGDALDDEAPKVRSEAFRTLWAWHTATPHIPLARGAASRHADLRTQVINEIDRRRQAKQSTPDMEKLLLGLVKDPVAQVGLSAFGVYTRPAEDGSEVVVPTDVVMAAMSSPAPAVRAAGAKASHKATASPGSAGARSTAAGGAEVNVRTRLVELVKEDIPVVHLAAIEALDVVAPTDAEGFAIAWNSIFWELQVRAGELCGKRRDNRAVSPMERILSIPKTDINRPPDVIRHRAAAALADVGDIAALKYLLGLISDEDPLIREMAARGIATAARPGHEAALSALLALLGHNDLPVRSWGAEGLAKLGDLRALPVLAGTQRHDHRPLRIGAIVGFVALGPEGVRGLRQGLEDKDREIQDLAFSVIVARDAALAEAGIAPDLLVDTMASPNPEIRFAAARLFERRASGTPLDAESIADIVGPRKPEKAADMKDWPPPPRRAAILDVLRNAIASDEPATRYAAAQVLAVRNQPVTFWREAARLAGPTRPGGAPAPNTGFSFEGRVARRPGWLRRLVTTEKRDAEATELEGLAKLFLRANAGGAAGIDVPAAHRLVFGAYAGLVRQAPARGDADETHRVRRDAVGRLVELAREEAVGTEAVLPVLEHAVGDPHHLVRQAALAALRSLYPHGALAPLAMAIAAAPDLGRDAIDELLPLAIEGDERAVALIRGALDADHSEVRAHAAMRLERLFPAGSAEPQLIAARSKHSDVRLAAITQLASAATVSPAIASPGSAGARSTPDGSAQVIDALVAALGSEHADLRLKAAVALARKGNSLGIDVLGAFLRDADHWDDALEALVSLADRPESAGTAAELIANRFEDDPDKSANRPALLRALTTLHHAAAAPMLIRFFTQIPTGGEGAVEPFVPTAMEALRAMLVDRTKRPQTLPDGRTRVRYREADALRLFAEAAKSSVTSVRMAVAVTLGDIDERGAEDPLAKLLADREPTIRVAAAEALALRAEYVPGATLTALDAALRGGRRELVLPAALGLAARKRPEAFQPLLLVAKAGEPPEQERALLALGSLGDRRALDQLLPLLDPEPDDELAKALMPTAVEALGRLLPSLQGDEANDIRTRLERLAFGTTNPSRARALTGLRYAGQIGVVERVAADRDAPDAIRIHALGQLGLALSPSSEPLLAELLSDDSYAVRLAAVAALGKLLQGDRTRLSLYALGSPHDHISAPAATYLAASGDAATLVERFGSVKSADVRKMLREGLIRRGELPRPQLEAALRGKDPRPRAEAAWIAGYGGDAARPLADAVATAVAHAEAGFREAQNGPRTAHEKLADEGHAWRAALWAARRVGAAGAVVVEAAAANAAGDASKAPLGVRREAVEVLAAAGSGSALATLAKLVGDSDREVRAVATAAVAATQPGSAAGLVRAIGARADATTIAPLALAAWGELAKGLITEPNTRAWALAVSLQGKRVAELIALASVSGEDPVRLAAIAALGRAGGDEALVVLERIHNSESEPDAVKLAAWKALKRLLRAVPKEFADGQDKGGPKGGSGGGSSDDDDDGGDDDDDGGGDDDDAVEVDDDDAGDDDDDDDDDDGGDDDDDYDEDDDD